MCVHHIIIFAQLFSFHLYLALSDLHSEIPEATFWREAVKINIETFQHLIGCWRAGIDSQSKPVCGKTPLVRAATSSLCENINHKV